MEFIKHTSANTDIYCFQEVFDSKSDIKKTRSTRVNVLADLNAALPNFDLFLDNIGSGYDIEGCVDFDITESQATFTRKNAGLKVDSHGSVFVHGVFKKMGKHETLEDIPSNFQYMNFSFENKRFILCNLHGIVYLGHKKDTPERLRQSQMIKEFLAKEDGAKILCGDFNLLPSTKSISVLEENMRNLIAEFNIERTRSKLSPWWGKEGFQKFADYVFVSQDVRVMNFSVPDVDVSDHLPLVLEFS
ncbi:MAG: hypothetical protein Q7R94_01760 [bacterium]|nr:hypothetical protein [bacterium]